MNSKNRLQKLFRGWLPKEPLPLQSNQIRAAPINQRITAISARAIGGLAAGVFMLGFSFLAGPYILFPELYTPKSNSAWGYTAPRSIEGWIFIAVGIGLIFLSTFLFVFFAMKWRSQGSACMAQRSWITPRYTNDYQKSAYLTAIIANSLVVAAFVVAIAFAIAATVSIIAVFAVIIGVTNLLMYDYYKKKIANKTEDKKTE